MADTIDAAAVMAAVLRVAERVEGLRDTLNELDAAMGDGDLGISASKAGPAIREYVAATPPGDDIGKWLAGLGMAINRVASSTMGTLTATALMRAGKEAKGLSTLNAETLSRMLAAADAGMQERGKAQVGDKTVLDAMAPTVATLKTAAEKAVPLPEALTQSLAAAEAGLKATIPMKSKMGRAAWIAERSVGHQDPGATSFYLMWKSAVEYLTL